MSPQKLSQVLRGLNGLSVQAAQKTAKLLDLKPDESELFVALVGKEHARSGALRKIHAENVNRLTSIQSAEQHLPEEFTPLSDALSWTCFLLVDVADFQADFHWIARRTGASVEECRQAFDRLVSAKLLSVTADGRWIQNKPLLQYAFPTSAPDIRKFYSELSLRAHHAVETTPYETRHNHVVMLPISMTDYAEMKLKIDQFAQSLFEEYANKSSGADRVYACNFNFFPLDKDVTT